MVAFDNEHPKATKATKIIDPRTEEGERVGLSRYCDYLEDRISKLEVGLRQIAGQISDRPAHEIAQLALSK